MAKGKWCTKCGTHNDVDARFCAKCGHRFVDTPASSVKGKPTSIQEAKRHSLFDTSRESMFARVFLIVLIAGVLFVIIGQNAIDNAPMALWTSTSLESYQESMQAANQAVTIGAAMAIIGGAGLVSFFVRNR